MKHSASFPGAVRAHRRCKVSTLSQLPMVDSWWQPPLICISVDGASKIVGDRRTHTASPCVCTDEYYGGYTTRNLGQPVERTRCICRGEEKWQKLLSQQRRGRADDSIAALMTAGTDGHTNRCHYWAPCRTRQQSELTQAYCAGPDSLGVHTHTNTYSQPQVDSVLPT